MLRAMFGMGGSEILVILIVALIFLGPDKLPEAAKQISKGIRDIKKQSRALQQTIEDDENIGGALRDLRSALRGEEPPPPKPKPPKQIEAAPTPDPVAPADAAALAAAAPAAEGATTEGATTQPAADATPAPAKDPHDHDAEVAASVFADSFESGHMTAPAPASTSPAHEPVAAPAITLPPTVGEPGEATSTSISEHADADLAALVKPAPNTIARGATPTAASGPEPAVNEPRDATRGGVNGPASPDHPLEGGHRESPPAINKSAEPEHGQS
jgi:sec-independent protein translocase protein TatB